MLQFVASQIVGDDLVTDHTHTPDLNCGMQDLVSQIGIEPGPPVLGVWGLSHWTTREVP